MLNKHESVEKEKQQSNSKKNGVVKNGNGVNGHTLMDFSKIKTCLLYTSDAADD